MKILPYIILILILLIQGCAKPAGEIDTSIHSMRPVSAPDDLSDDMGYGNLAAALRDNIERLEETGIPELRFGPDKITTENYIKSLEYLIEVIESGSDTGRIENFIKENFKFYEARGKEERGQVLITSYYEPVIPGSRVKTEKMSQPLYEVPDDLVKINLEKFADIPSGFRDLKEFVESGNRVLYGRLESSEWGTRNVIVPYYTRKEIDGEGKLEGRGLEMAWVDPIDAFFLHIQGSGTVRFGDGSELRVGYASQNGHRYQSIGKYLYSEIPPEKMSKLAIEKYLREIDYIDMRNILYKNPSYIFFTNLEGKPLTSFGTEVIKGRTIATDPEYYPKGALAYMEFEKPEFADKDSLQPETWHKTSRFVLDHDTGGAIKGPHRVDLFWGRGDEAERKAGVMKNHGRLLFLAPDKKLIRSLSEN